MPSKTGSHADKTLNVSIKGRTGTAGNLRRDPTVGRSANRSCLKRLAAVISTSCCWGRNLIRSQTGPKKPPETVPAAIPCQLVCTSPAGQPGRQVGRVIACIGKKSRTKDSHRADNRNYCNECRLRALHRRSKHHPWTTASPSKADFATMGIDDPARRSEKPSIPKSLI